MAKKPLTRPCLQTYQEADEYARNRLLLDWLSDDEARAELFKLINEHGGSLEFPSRDPGRRECDGDGDGDSRSDPHGLEPEVGHKTVLLVTRRETIEQALRDDGAGYSNRVYAELGGGNFMLALDACPAHKAQREVFTKCFPHDPDLIQQLSHAACQSAGVMALRAPEFDLALFAEQAAVRFCQMLLGYSFRDYPLLETGLRAGYRALVHQVFGRHFVTDPRPIPLAKSEMARLLARTSELIDAYGANDKDALKGCHNHLLPEGMQPVMQKLGKCKLQVNGGQQTIMNGEQRAVIAVGAAVGTVGNVQAAACIAVKGLFADDELFTKARRLAYKDSGPGATEKYSEWQALIQRLLSGNPPIPYLPRRLTRPLGKVQEVILALGGGTPVVDSPDNDDPLIWGLPPHRGRNGAASVEGSHWCVGRPLAWPLTVEIVRQVMRLPGLAQRLDPEDASILGLKKRCGFACESYPLTHQRERRVAQSSLNVAMRLKSPIRESADRVRDVIRSGAPRIEEALRESRHVHFAWFELIEADTVLVLHTVYDGPFWAYVQHFALKVGDLFDALFECIENPPPMPVEKFPNEFVAHIQRYDRAPAAGYFFSAYPRSDVVHIQRDASGGR